MRYYVTASILAPEPTPIALTFKARDLPDALYLLKFFEYGRGATLDIDAITTRKPRGIDFVEII